MFIPLLATAMLLLCSFSSAQETTTKVDSETAKKLEASLSVLDTKKAACKIDDQKLNTGLCKDLAKYTCAPGSYNDGTGTITSGESEVKVEALKNDSKSYFSSEFLKVLKDPKNDYFRKLSLSALGLAHAPDCEKREDTCDAQVSKGLATVAMKRIFPNPNAMPLSFSEMTGLGGVGIQDLDLLTSNQKFVEMEKAFSDRLKNRLEHKKALDNIRDKVFPQIKTLVENQIKNSVSDPEVRATLISKIEAIKFAGDDCSRFSGNSNSNSIASLLIPNAFYNPKANTFTYCNGFLLNGDSDFQVAGIIAHELAHSIDPCGIALGPSDFAFKYSDSKNPEKMDSEFPFPGLAACLRSPNSVHAKSLLASSSRSVPQGSGGMGGDGDESVNSMPATCMRDQITESFADWTAANVLPEYIQKNHPTLTQTQLKIGYSNIFRSLCDNTQPAMNFGKDVHPELASRINRIILAEPKIRKQMGCPISPPEPVVYCSPKGDSK